MDHPLLPDNPAAALMTVVGLVIAFYIWSRFGSKTEDQLPIAFAAAAGGFIGAKVGFVVAEAPIWWCDDFLWFRLLYGKTVLGALLGGWLGVEIIKRSLSIRRPTGDDFARVIPIGIALGRIGCLINGCCPGRPLANLLPASVAELLASYSIVNWPAPLVEIGFQLTFLLLSFSTRKVLVLRNQHFHLYMIMYGLFRFGHEFVRDTPRFPDSWLTPYMVLAAACFIAGIVGFAVRYGNDRPDEKKPDLE